METTFKREKEGKKKEVKGETLRMMEGKGGRGRIGKEIRINLACRSGGRKGEKEKEGNEG